MVEAQPVSQRPAVSVIIPARNEEACLGACLTSIVNQEGVSFEVIVIDDGSTDRTRAIAKSFPQVRIVEPGPLPEGWIGKNNAVAAGARVAVGKWLLFTDADTVHMPGSLARTLSRAEHDGVALLSYSPEQEVVTFWERAIMPVIFAELASTYKPSEVMNPASPVAAANGQYLLIRGDVYKSIGGHAAVAQDLLEDVAIAKLVKQSGGKLSFALGTGVVRTRMYRNFSQLRDGWTKNLALLFATPRTLAAIRLAEFAVITVTTAVGIWSVFYGKAALATTAFVAAGFFYSVLLARIHKAHFSWSSNLLALIGLPMFAYLLVRSSISHKRGSVIWKGRVYDPKSSERTEHRKQNVQKLERREGNGLSHAQS
jgi:glycosyltransferase involved in cell wall biosynthesis